MHARRRDISLARRLLTTLEMLIAISGCRCNGGWNPVSFTCHKTHQGRVRMIAPHPEAPQSPTRISLGQSLTPIPFSSLLVPLDHSGLFPIVTLYIPPLPDLHPWCLFFLPGLPRAQFFPCLHPSCHSSLSSNAISFERTPC